MQALSAIIIIPFLSIAFFPWTAFFPNLFKYFIFFLFIFFLLPAFLYNQITKGIPTRVDHRQAPKSRFGLVPARPHSLPVRAGGIDIVFVHGLGSNPDTTWCAKRPTAASVPQGDRADSDQYVNWVSDFIPDDILPDRGARIFFYNYDSYWKRDAIHTRLSSLANVLLERIHEIRQSEQERSRGLIFVAYSYGGLVVKQALVQSHANPSLNHITEHTRAILFLGTPHRGSSFSVWGRLAARALQPLGSNPSILAEVEYDSTLLLDLHSAFVGTIPKELRVFNFFEQRPTQLLRLWFVQWQQFCVREQSAVYHGPQVGNFGWAVDHSGLNKFASRDENYNDIRIKLLEITASSALLVKHHYSVPLATVPTFTQRDELSKQLEERLQIRHEQASVPYAVTIYGLGGTGKSQLALKYAENQRQRYNPILWIDATDEEAVRSSFKRCAAELGLPEDRNERQGSALADAETVQAVLRWLRDRKEADDEWLVIVDNADDFTWGIQKIIPKGERGKIIITSQDKLSRKLVRECEGILVGEMSSLEGTILILRHLGLDVTSATEITRKNCHKVAHKLGYLALAIDLAGAYISNNSAPEDALTQYLTDYDVHRDKLLQMNGFRGLRPTEKTVWTVWDTTLQKIARESTYFQPDLLLTFLAHFKGIIVQDEIFRLAALGSDSIDDKLVDGIPAELRQFFSLNNGEWDSFYYRQSCNLLLRYSLLQSVGGNWRGVTMHRLVQWRALQDERSREWHWWHMVFIVAACHQLTKDGHQPEFRRHLIVHLPDIFEITVNGSIDWERQCGFIWGTFSRVFNDEGRWREAEKLMVQLVETFKTKLGPDHTDTLTSIANLRRRFGTRGTGRRPRSWRCR